MASPTGAAGSVSFFTSPRGIGWNSSSPAHRGIGWNRSSPAHGASGGSVVASPAHWALWWVCVACRHQPNWAAGGKGLQPYRYRIVGACVAAALRTLVFLRTRALASSNPLSALSRGGRVSDDARWGKGAQQPNPCRSRRVGVVGGRVAWGGAPDCACGHRRCIAVGNVQVRSLVQPQAHVHWQPRSPRHSVPRLNPRGSQNASAGARIALLTLNSRARLVLTRS
jgi:hypothetical protein